jgi:hypothetical protein
MSYRARMRSSIGVRRLTAASLAFALTLGVAQTIYSRDSMNPDGIAYLDMGDAYLRGDWAIALRTHWSPLYGWLLGAVLRLVQPPATFEFPLVHLVNLLVYVGALGAFTILLHEILATARLERPGRGCTRLPEWALVSLAYGAFLWSTLQYMPIGLVTPDLLVAALLYALCGLVLRLRRRPTRRAAVLLGLVLGLGCLAKAPLLPLAAVFLAVAALALKDRSKRIPMLAASVGALCLVVVPFVVTLSVANGRPTVSDSARLNYLWRVDGAPFVHWLGVPEGIGQPLHHSTLLLERPAVYSFESPFPVTYAAWYAPEYWFEGARPEFLWSEQLRVMGDALTVLGRLALELRFVLLALVVLLAIPPGLTLRGATLALVLLVPAVAAGAMYSLVLVEERYIAPFVVLALLGLASLVRLPGVSWSTALAGALTSLAVVSLLAQVGSNAVVSAAPTLLQAARGQLIVPDDQARVAEALRAAGLRPGDRVASGNRGFNAYWARLARVSIVAEVSGYDGPAILESDPEARAATQNVLLAQPVRAVVASGWPAQSGDRAWVPVPGTAYFYYLLPDRS